MAVSPVPDQRSCDSIYEERYAGLPDEDPEAYRISSPITYAQGLTGHLLLVHGSGGDNVHYQGTERLVNRLVELGKAFDLMVYPTGRTACARGRGRRCICGRCSRGTCWPTFRRARARPFDPSAPLPASGPAGLPLVIAPRSRRRKGGEEARGVGGSTRSVRECSLRERPCEGGAGLLLTVQCANTK